MKGDKNQGTYFGKLDSTWDDERFRELGVRTGLKTLFRAASRENLVRAFDLACGNTLEFTYDPIGGGERAGQRQMAQNVGNLLELVAQEIEDRAFKEEAATVFKEAAEEGPGRRFRRMAQRAGKAAAVKSEAKENIANAAKEAAEKGQEWAFRANEANAAKEAAQKARGNAGEEPEEVEIAEEKELAENEAVSEAVHEKELAESEPVSEVNTEKEAPKAETQQAAPRKPKKDIREFEQGKPEIGLMVQNAYVAGHYDFPEGRNPLADPNSPTWATDVMDYMYYMAVRKLTDQKIPDVDYRDPEQLKSCAEACTAYRQIMQDLVQISDGDYEQQMVQKYPDFKEKKEALSTAALIQKAYAVLGREQTGPLDNQQLVEQLQARMIMEKYGEVLRGKTCEEAAKNVSFQDFARMPLLAAEFAETLTWNEDDTLNTDAGEKERMVADYLDRKPGSFCPIVVKGDQFYLSPALDKRIPNLDLNQVKEDFAKGQGRKAQIFDKLFDEFPDDPIHNTEPAYKRIYIDGKNAYELFRGNYKGTEQEIEAAVKADIIDTLAKGTNRVEMARMVKQQDGQMRAYVVPVRADLKVLDADKKWYQHSLAKQEEKLWSNDSEADARRADIAKDACARHQDDFYKGLLEAANAVRREHMGTDPEKKADFLEAERRMKAEPDLAREWGIQKTAQAYKQMKQIPKVLRSEPGQDISYEDAVSAVRIAAAAQDGISNCNFNDLAIGRQFKEYADTADKIMTMELPDEFYETYEMEQLKKNQEAYQRRWAREDAAAMVNPLTEKEQAYREFKRAETLADLKEEAGMRYAAQKLLPFAEELAGRMELLENRDIIAMADDTRREELDAHFLGTYRNYKKLRSEGTMPHSEASAYEPYRRVRACEEKVIETVASKIKNNFNPEATPAVCRNQFRAVRQVMENIGINQQEMDAYAEKLDLEQRNAYEYIRSWEKQLVRQNDDQPIQLPEGVASVKDALDTVVDIYKNAYCDKLGFVNRIDPYFVEKVKVPEDIVRMKSAERELSANGPDTKIPGPNPMSGTKTSFKELMEQEAAFREKNDTLLARTNVIMEKAAKKSEREAKVSRERQL